MILGKAISPFALRKKSSGGGGGTDPDAQAFITATGISGTNATATNQLVIDLKAANIWTKMKAIYPMVGGTATAHKFNLKNPLDTDAAFRLNFLGGGTHSSNGYQPNGINAYADTFLTPSTALTLNNTHLSYYSRTTTINFGERDIAVYVGGNDPVMALGTNSGVYLSDSYNFSSNRITAIITSAAAFFIGSRTTSTVHKLYRNNVQLGTTNTVANTITLPTQKIYIGAANNTPNIGTPVGSYSSKECAFASIGDGLNDAEALALYNAVNAFQVSLARNV